MNVLEGIEAELLKIPVRPPDLNPIENIFHIVKCHLRDEAEEIFPNFGRVLAAFKSVPCDVIETWSNFR